MTTIQVKRVEEQTLESGRYFYVEMINGKHSAFVAVQPYGVQVIVENSAHKVWRGMGKMFATTEKALASYKTDAIKAMISHAVELARVSADVSKVVH